MDKNKTKKDYRKIMRGLVAYLKEEWMMLLLSLLILLAANLLALWGPRLSGQAVDAFGLRAEDVNIPLVLNRSLWMFASYAGSALLTYINARLMVRVSQRIISKMRQDTYNKILDLPLAYLDTHQTGDLVSRISYDLDVINQSLTHDVIQIAASFVTVVGSLWMMISISWPLSIIFLALLPITVIFTNYRIRKTRPLFRIRSRKLGEMNGYVEEVLYGQETIRAYDKEKFFSDEFYKRNSDSIEAYFQADYQAAINMPSVTFISNLSIALVTTLGSLLFISRGFSLGGLAAFILYARRFSGPINEISGIVAELQSSLSAAERVFKLLEEPSEPADKPSAITLKDPKGEVEFKDVVFEYLEGSPVIKNLSLKVKPGSLTAIVGPTGAGKTTLINLLMRFYDPASGTITIDGHDSTDVTRASLRQSFAMVLQDTWLFKGTVKENIAYGKPEAKMEDIIKAAKASHVHDFIMSLEHGYETEIEDGASNLSQGQKQLLTIARAMLLDTPMLILDEATSNVDSRTEIHIQEAMNNLIKGRTSFVIAHRLSTIKNADTILVMRDGDIREQGTHEELLNKEGIYAGLYRAQFE